ncbi:hypothetical protein TFLX_00893 [Thermoflexales bacterium]|nr:hypothetical protein TFLX_00893 [Thermoflexales bacterium]
MTKAQRGWVYRPHKSSVNQVLPSIKAEVQRKAEQLIGETLKPRHLKPPPITTTFNYIVDIYTKWYRHYFYFCAKYCVPGSNALTPDFEAKFARLEYTGHNHFNLSFRRYTEEWIEIHSNLSIDQCFAAIRDDPLFDP